jgi:predicted SAM-dependent methyltransferase
MRKLLLSFFSHRTLALIRWDIHFVGIRAGNRMFSRTGKLLKEISKKSGPLYLNLGSGPRGLNSSAWINIDGFKDKNVQYLCDFSRALPFEDETFDGIFCEHVFEHFTYENGRKLMLECRRILKKSGVLRIIVPDGNKVLSSYFNEPQKIVEYKQVESGFAMEAVNTWFYQRYEHQCIYDAAYLTDSLQKAGFSETKHASYNISLAGNQNIVLDDPKYSWESLYIEAIK